MVSGVLGKKERLAYTELGCVDVHKWRTFSRVSFGEKWWLGLEDITSSQDR